MLPKVIETDEEFDRLVAVLEELLIPERELSPEEAAAATLLEKLIADYDDRHYAMPAGKLAGEEPQKTEEART